MSSLIDNTAKWGVRKLTKFQENSGLPVGFEYFSTNPNIPAGSIPLFGGEYSREVYSDLWSWVQEQAGYLLEESAWQEKSAANGGNVPFYSKGNGTTTFRVPSLNCWVKGANGIEEVGSYLSAGLPNITGTIESRPHTSGNTQYGGAVVGASGAFKFTKMTSTTTNTGCAESSTQSGNDVTTFSAQTSNPIYGNSDTVQPKSIVGMWLVKAYGTITNVGSTDVSNIAQGLTELETRVVPIEKGGTGATTKAGAQTNLGLNDAVVKLSVSGRTITYTQADGGTGTITTQDTVYSNPAKTYVSAVYRSGTQWYIVFASGMIMQGGYQSRGGDTITITFPKAFSNTNYQVFKSTQNSSANRDTQIYEQFWDKSTTKVNTYDQKNGIMWVAFGY